MASALLGCQNLSFNFGPRTLFQQLSFEVSAGDFWVICGPSGVGKSTFLKLLTGEISTDAKIFARPQILKAEVPQGLALCPGLSALETISTGELRKYKWWQSLFGLPPESLLRAADICKSFQLQACQDQKIETLSGGERQRAAIGRALIQDPELMIADEPVSMLDEELAKTVLNILRQKLREKGGAVICVLHQTELIHQFATHILEINPGLELGWRIRAGAAK